MADPSPFGGGIIQSILGPTAKERELRYQNLDYNRKLGLSQATGSAQAGVLKLAGDLAARGVPPAQILPQVLSSKEFSDFVATGSGDPKDITAVIQQMVQNATPQVNALAPGAQAVTSFPGNPNVQFGPTNPTTDQQNANAGLSSGGDGTQEERAWRALVLQGKTSKEYADRWLAGSIDKTELKDDFGSVIGAILTDKITGQRVTISKDSDPAAWSIWSSALGANPQMGQGAPGGQVSATATGVLPNGQRPQMGLGQPQPGQNLQLQPGQPGPQFSVQTQQAPKEYQPLIDRAERQYGLPPGMLASLLAAESSFNPNIVSSAGAQGIAQFMPGTAKDFGVNPWDPSSAIDGAARFLTQNLRRYSGNVTASLAAYNWGPLNVDRWLARGADPSKLPAETQGYIARITGQPVTSNFAGGGSATGGPPQQPPSAQAKGSVVFNSKPPSAQGQQMVQNLLADPSEMFLGAGFIPMADEFISGITGQADSSKGDTQNTVRRNALRQLEFAVDGLRTDSRLTAQQVEDLKKLVPSANNPIADPKQAVTNGIQLFDLVLRYRNEALGLIADKSGIYSNQAKDQASQGLRLFDNVLNALPTREQMEDRLDLLKQGKGGQLGAPDVVKGVQDLLNSGTKAIGGATGQEAPGAAKGPDRSKAIGTMDIIGLSDLLKDVSNLTDAELEAAKQRILQLQQGGK